MDAGPPGFEVALITSNPNAPLDGRTGVELRITRTGGFAGDIAIAGLTPPNGLQVDDLTIPGDQDLGEVPVGAVAPLAIGDKVSFTLEATAAGLDAQQVDVTDAEVTGKPGTTDITFGPAGTGYTSISFGSDDNAEFKAIEILNGNLLVNGSGTGGLGATRMSAVRFTGAGLVDTTFNGGALVRRGFAGGSNDFSDGVAIGHQFDGRPIMIGYHVGAALNDFAASRLTTTGGEGGVDFGSLTMPSARVLIDLGGDEICTDGLVLADSRILFVGSSGNTLALALATSSGSLDLSVFGGTGFVREALGTSATANGVVVDSADRLVVAGSFSDLDGSGIVVTRYTLAGLDTTFGTNGRTLIVTPGVAESAIGVGLAAGGKIIVGSSTGAGNYRVRRFNPDGSLDTTFGIDGLGEVTGSGTAFKMAVLRDGRILFLGDTAIDAELVRFAASGKPDPFFGTNSVKNLPFGSDHTARALTVFDAHQVVIGGGNSGGTPGPGTSGVIARVWM